MKSSTCVLALAAVLCASPVVHAQIYIDQPFTSNPNIITTPSTTQWASAGGANPWAYNSTLGRVQVNRDRSLTTPTFTAAATSTGFVEYDWGYNGGGISFTIALNNITTGNSTSFLIANNVTGVNQSFTNLSLNAPLTAGNVYTLSFTTSGVNGSEVVWLDNLLVYQVPGPIPVLGALMAFGWSRKLRSRIREAQA